MKSIVSNTMFVHWMYILKYNKIHVPLIRVSNAKGVIGRKDNFKKTFDFFISFLY